MSLRHDPMKGLKTKLSKAQERKRFLYKALGQAPIRLENIMGLINTYSEVSGLFLEFKV